MEDTRKLSMFCNFSVSCSGNLLSGTVVASGCKIPCKRTTSTIVAGPVAERSEDANDVYITFTDQVSVTRVTVDSFDLMTALNFLGSNLGLWPGLGLYQMLEGAIGLLAIYKVGMRAKHFCRCKWK